MLRGGRNKSDEAPAGSDSTRLFGTYVFMIAGSSRPTPYSQLLRQHSRVPPAGLLQLLQQSLQQVQQSGFAGAEVRIHSSSMNSLQENQHLCVLVIVSICINVPCVVHGAVVCNVACIAC